MLDRVFRTAKHIQTDSLLLLSHIQSCVLYCVIVVAMAIGVVGQYTFVCYSIVWTFVCLLLFKLALVFRRKSRCVRERVGACGCC